MKGRTTLLLLCTLAVTSALASGDTAKSGATAAKSAQDEAAPVFDQKYLSSAANIMAGKTVWEKQCRHCHGVAAYPGKAPKLNPGQLKPDFIFDRVTYGFGKMPGWKEVFSYEERKSVVAYIKSSQFSP